MANKLRVLIVDDSVVFRSQIKAALSELEGVEFVGAVQNGKIALSYIEREDVDLVTLDMEMPVMDGIETLERMKDFKKRPKVVVFASKTTRGADIALEALRLGASDVVAKPAGNVSSLEDALVQIRQELSPKVEYYLKYGLERQKPVLGEAAKIEPAQNMAPGRYTRTNPFNVNPKAIVIASSTGGPQALEEVLKDLPADQKCPILIAQHMPPVFTASLAKRLTKISKTEASEAKQNEELLPGHIYVAPGDFHLSVFVKDNKVYARLDQKELRNSVRPAADFLFESAAKVYGPDLVGIVLTGMGSDGAEGSIALKNAEASVVIQDEESCVIFGMPGAVFENKSYDYIGNTDKINQLVCAIIKEK